MENSFTSRGDTWLSESVDSFHSGEGQSSAMQDSGALPLLVGDKNEERLPPDQQDLAEFKTVAGSRGPNGAPGAADAAPTSGVEQSEGLGCDLVNHTPVVIRPCDPDDRHTGWPNLLVQSRPEPGYGSLLSCEPKGSDLEREIPIRQLEATGCRRKLLQPLEQDAFHEELVRATAALNQCLDEALE